MKTVYFIPCLFLGLLSCKEDLSLRDKSDIYCRENMEFNCTEPLGEFYFKGKINGKDFCVSNEVDGYWMLNDIGIETTTSTDNPVLTPDATPQSSLYGFGFYPPIKDHWNGISEDFSPSVYIYTPSVLDTAVLPGNEYFDRFIKEGDLNLREYGIDKYSGFYFVIGWGCVLLPGYDYYYKKDPYRIPFTGSGISPAPGEQKDAVFRISEYKKTVLPDVYIYDLTFEIECDLYLANNSNDRRYYGRLEDGVFKTQAIVPYSE